MSTAALYALSNGFSLSLTGNATVVEGTPGPGEVSEFHRGMYEDLLGNDFGVVMGAMTESMSAAVQNDGTEAEKVRGEVFVQRVFVVVDWRWIAFPATLWGFATFLVIAVTVKTRRQRRGPVGWLGNSQVSGLFLGLEDAVRRDVDTKGVAYTGDGGEVRAFAEKLKLRIGTVEVLGEGRPMRFTKSNEF